ncbi:MAG TPA: alcohol dehydrogenase [Candidatus Aquilonibacter sp.]|nr:alcohol dehydrogenase [Candidatus Aquilonibacter sp.]
MAKMRAIQVPKAKGEFEFVEREIPTAGPGEVRIKVQACGVCHSDSVTKEGLFPNIEYPRVPGHEVVGVIDALGPNVVGRKVGERIGVGWHGGNCGYCDSCRTGDAFACENMTVVTGLTRDGGYAEYMLARAEALALVPEDLNATDAAPLMCAGVTTFNALRNSGARPGDLVAVFGLGGLGHLGVQYAAKLGFRTVGIARGKDKEPLAKQLGANHYIDNAAEDAAGALMKLGGAKVILATVTDAQAMASVIGGLGTRGTLLVIGAVRPMEINPIHLLLGSRSIKGWYSGTSIDSQQTMQFSELEGVKSMNEIFPFERAPEAYERMMSGKARFRAVITMASS